MAEMRATPYSNPFLGGVSGLVDAVTGWMKDPNRTQQMQALGGFIEGSGIPKTVQRMAYGEPITNINQANVPLLKPETGNAALTLLGALPVGAPAAKMLPKNIPVGMSIKPIGDVIPPMMPKAPVSPAGFYSAAEQAALNLQRNKGAGQAFINDLMKAPDVKKEELQYTGLIDAFANKPQATKQELIDFLQANRTNVGSVTRRDIKDMSFDDLRDLHIKQTGWDVPDSWGSGDIIDALDDSEIGTKYSEFTLPNGQRNREILLTLPSNNSAEKALQKFEAEMAQKYRAEGAMWPRVATYEELAKRNELTQAFKSAPPEYYGGHWDEPNVFAHVRVNDRIDADGKKMTLIEEVQSDWHQTGRERMYKGQYKPEELTVKPVQIDSLNDTGIFDKNGKMIWAGRGEGESANEVISRGLAELESDAVPDAPMKDTWYQTALRKAVKDAIDQGSDRVGIVTGARNAERFGKGKKIESIRVRNYANGDRDVEMTTPSGNFFLVVVDKDGVISDATSNLTVAYRGKPLEQMIGKDAAQRVLSNKGGEDEFLAKNVVLGGKGMKKYYDDVYPKYLDKFAKKYGSSIKEGSIRTSTKDVVPPEMVRGWDLGGLTPEEFVKNWNNKNNETVRYIEITPEMRKAFGGKDKGVPLFQMAPAIPAGAIGAGGLLDQFGQEQ